MDTKVGWQLLDTYFTTNSHFITQHHLDSYNHFITNRIPQVIRAFKAVTVIKPDPEDPRVIKHQIDVYIGGENGDNLFFDKPTIVDPDSGEQRLLFPNEARMFNYSYASDLYADILVRVTLRGESVEEKILKRVKIGSIPIMLQSKLCALHKQPFHVRREMGECPYDQGGYFIIDGKEKVCVAQERNITNSLFVTKVKDNESEKHSYTAFIRCTSEESSVFPKTVRFFVNRLNPANVGKTNAISVSVPHITTDIPLFILFRVLGVESDKDIIDSILAYETDERIQNDMREFLRPSAVEATFAYSQDIACEFLKSFVALKTRDNLYFVIERNLFPNLENATIALKARYLSYTVNQLVRVCMGMASTTDRDSYMYKRIGISGFLLGDIFKDYFNSFRVTFRNKIDKAYEYQNWKTQDSLIDQINMANKDDFFQSSIIAGGMSKSLKGSWGLDGVQGISQDLNRVSYIGFLSHLRRVNTPMDASIKLRRPHQLTTSQYGMVCPSESPDGGSIGLLKNFSILCAISFDVPTSSIKAAIEPFHVIYQDDMIPEHQIHSTYLSINNTWVGVVPDTEAPKLVRWIKLLRRNSLINNLISVSWNVFQKKINILTDNGRCTRPLFIVDEKSKQLLIDTKKTKVKEWLDYIRGDTLTKAEYDFYFAGYHDPFKRFPGKSIDEIIKILEANSAVVEYIDVEETNCSMIAMYPSDVPHRHHTHCEVHPSTMFSIYTVTVPFANHNAPTRLVFSGAQGKQAIGVYASNFNNRIDTMGYVLHYPQKPLVKTRFNDYMNTTQLPNGENLIVAICSYSGYNQEDSIIVSKRALERGMFNVSYYKLYGGEEKGGDGKGERVVFTNKNILAALGESFQVKPARYTNLDENGLPIVGSHIKEGDAYLGMYGVTEETQVVDEYGNEVKRKQYADRSLIADKTVSGTVDKVVMFMNKQGNKQVKIRMRKFRVPELGDKACSRHGQKGVFGMIMPQEDMPFTQDGIVPDIIINPHAFPTRMTIGHLIESIIAKTCVINGVEYDAVPFEKHDLDKFHGDLERKYGMHKYGEEIMYNGRTGEQMNTEIFFGPVYYQRLKHMVADKINYRTTGRVMGLTKQPTKGRSNEGGLRIGEMEANAIISHGMSSFIKEAFFERSDKYAFYMDHDQNTVSGKNRFNKRIMSPYTFKLLIQELQTMCIDPQLITDTEIDRLDEYDDIDFNELPMTENDNEWNDEDDF